MKLTLDEAISIIVQYEGEIDEVVETEHGTQIIFDNGFGTKIFTLRNDMARPVAMNTLFQLVHKKSSSSLPDIKPAMNEFETFIFSAKKIIKELEEEKLELIEEIKRLKGEK